MAKHLCFSAVVAVALFLFINTHLCDGRQEEEEPSGVVLWGSVFCDTCSQNSLHSATTYFITGATVAVECSLNRKARASIRVEGRTDESGEFRIELPSSICNTYSISGCSVEAINSPDGSCNVPSVGKLAFTLTGQRGNVYGAGHLSYRPQEVPSACFVEEEDSQQRISYVRGREALEADETSKQTALPPPLLPNLFPPLSIPPVSIPKVNVPPLPSIPTLSGPPLPTIPTLSVPPLPKFSIPPFALNIPFFAPPPSK